MKNIRQKSAGFTIAELIIAISVLSFGVVLVYGSFYSIYTATYNVAPRFTAAYLASEALEVVRNIRDNNFVDNQEWSDGLTGSPCNTGCQLDYKTDTAVQTSDNQLKAYNDNLFLSLNGDGFYSYDTGGTATIFRRKITITPVAGTTDALKVEILVTWTYKDQLLHFTTEAYLYDWH